MTTFEEFEKSLRHVLVEFRDPAYHPPELLWPIVGFTSQQGVETVQHIITQAIENLKPATLDTSSSLRRQRFYELLTYRYIQDLTQEETAERLGITPRHVRREQQQAIHELARRLWEKKTDRLAPAAGDASDEAPAENNPATAWRSQVREELAVLQQSAPGSVTEVAEAVQGVLKIGQALTAQRGVSLNVAPIDQGLTVAMHPSALRQVLITAIEKLGQSIAAGQIALKAERSRGRLQLTMSGEPAITRRPPNSDLIQEILTAHGGAVEAYLEGDQTGFRIDLPTADKITVLVIDDNADLVHFYRRYITGTRYQIVHLEEAQHALDTIKETHPDIIVLDVMLPDIDGWELLTDLRELPETQQIPVIVCSVIRRAELALSLGATLHLPKPVRRREFIQALDQIIN